METKSEARKRRQAEHAVRNAGQSRAERQAYVFAHITKRKRSTLMRSPVVGSAEWAETRGDDLGESPDY